MSAARYLACWVLFLAHAGCAASSGQDWLSVPLEQDARAGGEGWGARAAQARMGAPPGNLNAAAEGEPKPRPRLQHTLTLGGSYASAGAPEVAAAAPGPGSSVYVSVSTHVPVTVNNYGSFGDSVVADAPAPARAARGATLQPGQDFPSPPNYGPPFPYRTGPASPWAR